MTNKELIEKVIDLYKEARVTINLKKNIRRGRSHSISSKVEDLMAVYISEFLSDNSGVLPDNIELLIDQPFTYHIDKTYAIYPDIAVIKDNKVVKLFDIKMDLGWKRDFYPFCKKKQELIDEIQGIDVKTKDGVTKEKKSYHISQTVKYNIIIISNKNISQKKREENELRIATLDKKKIEVFILTQEIHPNNYDEQVVKNIQLRQLDFDNLKNEIENNGA
jgi:hypothetical protein